MKKISTTEGFKLLFTFLEGYYCEYASQDQEDESLLANLLGDMDILDDGITADPAVWFDWIDSIAKANSITNMQIPVTDVSKFDVNALLEPMIIFLERYYVDTGCSSKLICLLIRELHCLKNRQEANSFIRELWLKLTSDS
jgi:hypothetical protein